MKFADIFAIIAKHALYNLMKTNLISSFDTKVLYFNYVVDINPDMTTN